MMKKWRKITVAVRSDLLERAQNAARAGVSETVRKGLELLAASNVYDRLLKMGGKVKFSVHLRELRQDREPQRSQTGDRQRKSSSAS